jgi:DNA repair protein RadC
LTTAYLLLAWHYISGGNTMSTALQQYIVPRYRLALVREGEHPAMFPAACTCTGKAQLICEEYFQGIDREHSVMIALDTKNNIIGFHVISIGTLNETFTHPREIFKAAFLMNAARIILAHNHPSGDPTPSDGDIARGGKTMNPKEKEMRQEAKERIIECLKNGYTGYYCDLHDEVFNTDYYIIGIYEAKKALERIRRVGSNRESTDIRGR